MTRNQKSKRRTFTPTPNREAMTPLKVVEQSQQMLRRAEALAREGQRARKQAVAAAWAAGATAKEIAGALNVSLAKTYTLLPKRLKA